MSTPTRTTKYAVSYKLDGERRFEFAQLESPSVDEALAALLKLHGSDERITDVKVSKAL